MMNSEMHPLNENSAEPQKQSVLGIISVFTAIATAGVVLILFVFAGYLESATPGGVDEESAAAIIAGLGIVGSMIFFVIGAVLGFAGLFQTSRKKLFPIVGAFLNLFFVLGVAGMIVLGVLKG